MRIITDTLFDNPNIKQDLVALIDDSTELTYAELQQQVLGLAGTLREMGVRKGDRVAVLCRNRIEYIVAYYGILAAGAIYVPLNWRLHPDELVRLIRNAGATVLIAEDSFLESLPAHWNT